MPDGNIVCLVIDRLRAAALGAYGAGWCETPELDKLASESLLLDNALVDVPELESLYRSLWQGAHAMVPAGQLAEASTLPGVLEEAGVTTTLLSDETAVVQHPLASDFQECVRLAVPQATEAADDVEQTQLARFFAAALEGFDQARQRAAGGPFLLWLHSQGMAGPWDAPWQFRNRLADEEDPPPPAFREVPNRRLPADYDPDELLGITQAYTGQIVLLDQCLGALLDHIEASGAAGDTLLVLVGARGFPLGEHLRVGPVDGALYSELLHVPLVLRFPDRLGALVRGQALVELCDLPATLLDWIGCEPLSQAGGASLLPFARGEAEASRDRICMAGGQGQRAIRTPAWHLLQESEGGPAELYVKPDDRWEVNEISARCPEIVAGLGRAIAEFEEAVASGRTAPLAPLEEMLVTPPE